MDKQDAEGAWGGMQVRAAAGLLCGSGGTGLLLRRCVAGALLPLLRFLPPSLIHAACCCASLQAGDLSNMFEGLHLAGRPEQRDDDLVGQFGRMGLAEGREALPARGFSGSMPQVGPRHAGHRSLAMAWGASAAS